MASLIERHRDQILGVLSCLGRGCGVKASFFLTPAALDP